MKRFLFLCTVLFLSFNLVSVANNELGGEISYQRVSTYSYLIKYKQYRDCQGAAAQSTAALNIKSLGCSAGRTVSLNLASRRIGKPYGSATPTTCTGTASNPLFEIATYSGLVNFSAAEFKCKNWVLSVSSTSRTPAENIIASTGNANFYTEAHLNLVQNIVNSSPVFDTLNSPLLYVNYQTDYNLKNLAAKDPEGDSLAYKLVAPLTAPNMPVAYQNINTGAIGGLPTNYIMNPNPKPPYSNPFNPQLAQITGNPNLLYGPLFPIFSIIIDWNGPPTIPVPGAPFNGLIWAANPYFTLNATTGELRFNPIIYNHSQNIQARNKYLVSVLVEEYRKINGVTTKLGSVRRETLIQVFYNNINLNPKTAPVYGNTPAQLRSAKPINSSFSAYPNPFSEELTFNLSLQNKAKSIVIYNMLGQQVDQITLLNSNPGQQTIKWENAAKHAAGSYVAKLVSENKSIQTLKFTKIN